MNNFILSLLIIFTIVSCSGGGEGGGDPKTVESKGLPAGQEIKLIEFLKLIPNYNPSSVATFNFKGAFSFNKEDKKCSGSLDTSISLNLYKSNISSSGYCKGKNIKKKLKAQGLELLNFEKIGESLTEDLKIVDLGSNEFRLSFEKQENWTRSYTFKVDEKAGTIIFPVILRYNYSDQYQKMNWQIEIQKGSDIPSGRPSNTQSIDAMDLAESAIYNIF